MAASTSYFLIVVDWTIKLIADVSKENVKQLAYK